MRHLDLFSGIGGFALASEMVWESVEHIFCEIDPFCQAVLSKHWPNSAIYGDIREFTKEGYAKDFEEPVDIDLLTGGFPCQPFSQAGRRKGTEDDRHLWPEMLRVIREFHPRWIIGENVGGFVTWNGGMVLEQVHSELESEGYSVQAFIIPAVAVNAPHRRDRVWIVAHTESERGERKPSTVRGKERRPNDERLPEREHTNSDVADTRRKRWGTRPSESMEPASKEPEWKNHRNGNWDANWLEVAARFCTLDDGLPNGLARPRGWRNAALKGAGNAIVPQVAAEIMRAIVATENAI